MFNYKKIIVALFLILFISPTLKSDEPSQNDAAGLLIEYQHNSMGWPLLHFAIHMNRPDIALLALQLYPEQASTKTPTITLMDSYLGNNADQDYDYVVAYENGTSALELAVRHQDIEIVMALLQLGTDAKEMRTEYHSYYSDGRVKFVNAHMYRTNFETHSLLYWALKSKNIEIVKLLLQYGAPLGESLVIKRNWRDNVDVVMTAMQVAAELEDDDFLRKLIYHQTQRANLQELSDEEAIPSSTVTLFRTYWQNPSAWPALHYALSIDNIEAFKLLLMHGEDIHFQGKAPASLLSLAIAHADPAYLNLLLDNYDESEVAYVQSIANGNLNLLSELLSKYPADPKLLDLAVQTHQIEIVKLLLEYGLQSPSAIQLAVKENKIDLLELLLECQGELQPSLEDLENAIAHKNDKMVQMLVNRGYTHPMALSLAIKSHSIPIFVFFLESGFQEEGALMSTVENNEAMMLQLIVERDGISHNDCELLKKRSIELGRTDILTYLLQGK
jgi:ankyrin repeat protein